MQERGRGRRRGGNTVPIEGDVDPGRDHTKPGRDHTEPGRDLRSRSLRFCWRFDVLSQESWSQSSYKQIDLVEG